MAPVNDDNSPHFDLIPAYALDALSDDERRQVELLLAESEDAREALRTYREMLTGFGALTASQAAPRKAPAHLTDDFRKRLAVEAAHTDETVRVVPITPAQLAIAKPQSMTQRRNIRLGWLATAAAILVIALGLFGLSRVAQTDSETRILQDILSNPTATHIALPS